MKMQQNVLHSILLTLAVMATIHKQMSVDGLKQTEGTKTKVFLEPLLAIVE
jgi:hypothetical protein